MRKIFTILLAFSSTAVFAQHAQFARVNDSHSRNKVKRSIEDNTTWYGRIGVGYAFTQAGQVNSLYGAPYSGSVSYDNTGATITSFNYKKASLNAGVNTALAVGRMFGPHIGLELAAQFNVAPTHYNFSAHNLTVNGNLADITIATHAKLPIFLIPAAVFQTTITDKLQGYGRLGVVLPVNTKVEVSVNNTDATGNYSYTAEQIAKFNLGFSGALGVKYEVGSNLKIWAEFNVMSLSTYTKKEELKSYTENGQPIPLYQLSSTNTTYALSGSNSNPNNGTGPQATTSTPFSNAGIMLGVSMRL